MVLRAFVGCSSAGRQPVPEQLAGYPLAARRASVARRAAARTVGVMDTSTSATDRTAPAAEVLEALERDLPAGELRDLAADWSNEWVWQFVEATLRRHHFDEQSRPPAR